MPAALNVRAALVSFASEMVSTLVTDPVVKPVKSVLKETDMVSAPSPPLILSVAFKVPAVERVDVTAAKTSAKALPVRVSVPVVSVK